MSAQDVQVLPCMHVFHKACIEEYAHCKGRAMDQCCPFKCDVSQSQVVMDLDPPMAATAVADSSTRSDGRDILQTQLDEADAAAQGMQ